MESETGVITVEEAAKWLRCDCQTIRLMLRQKVVDWGICFRREPSSRHYSYLIFKNKFSEQTGYKPTGEGASEA